MARVTLRDVAQASGVSRSTVSFVLNERADQTISIATQERVRQAARDLGYVPHGIARALAEGSSRVVVLYLDSRLEGNYSRTFIHGLDQELAAQGHVLLVRHGDRSPESTQQVLDTISPRAVLQFGGAYLSGHDLDDVGGGWRDGLAAHSAIQISYLAERGHTQIAIALPAVATPFSQARERFARETAESLGLPGLATLALPTGREDGARILQTTIAGHPGLTAVAALNDDLALRTLAAINDLGLTVPDDLAVIGYDETSYGALLTPALTTVRIDAEAHGRLFARLALGLDGSDISYEPGRVIVRDSA
jgi:DNA-binding LacI/PurR family transcriptional regulator